MSKYLSLLFFLIFIAFYAFLLHSAAEEKFKVFNDVQNIKNEMQDNTKISNDILNRLENIEKSLEKKDK